MLPAVGEKWHRDEVALTIAGRKPWLWCVVDQTGRVLDIPVRSRRDTRAAKRLLRKLLKRQCRAPRIMLTVKLASHGAAKCRVMPSVEHRKHEGLHKGAKTSHRPTRRRERQMQRFESAGPAQRPFSAHGGITASSCSATIACPSLSIELLGSKPSSSGRRSPVLPCRSAHQHAWRLCRPCCDHGQTS